MKKEWINKYDISGYWGWTNLLNELIERIKEWVKEWDINEDFQITYIKEKYGWLRIEYINWNNYSLDLLLECEVVSEWICQSCWAIGRIRGGSRYKCLCNTCNK